MASSEAMNRVNAEVAVVGGGPAGLTAAIALASAGIATALIARPRGPDNRTTALWAGSVTALNTLGVWEGCRPHAAPLRVMRIVDDTMRLIRAPEVSFVGVRDRARRVRPQHRQSPPRRRPRSARARAYGAAMDRG